MHVLAVVSQLSVQSFVQVPIASPPKITRTVQPPAPHS
jgi:hypothetical protein